MHRDAETGPAFPGPVPCSRYKDSYIRGRNSSIINRNAVALEDKGIEHQLQEHLHQLQINTVVPSAI
jgi:hypothetical protein